VADNDTDDNDDDDLDDNAEEKDVPAPVYQTSRRRESLPSTSRTGGPVSSRGHVSSSEVCSRRRDLATGASRVNRVSENTSDRSASQRRELREMRSAAAAMRIGTPATATSKRTKEESLATLSRAAIAESALPAPAPTTTTTAAAAPFGRRRAQGKLGRRPLTEGDDDEDDEQDSSLDGTVCWRQERRRWARWEAQQKRWMSLCLVMVVALLVALLLWTWWLHSRREASIDELRRLMVSSGAVSCGCTAGRHARCCGGGGCSFAHR